MNSATGSPSSWHGRYGTPRERAASRASSIPQASTQNDSRPSRSCEVSIHGKGRFAGRNYPFGMFARPAAPTGPDPVHQARPASRPWSDTPKEISIPGAMSSPFDPRAGGRPGMKVHVALRYGLFTGGLGAHYGAERLGCTVIPVSGGMTDARFNSLLISSPTHHGDPILHAVDPR